MLYPNEMMQYTVNSVSRRTTMGEVLRPSARGNSDDILCAMEK
jgi:hypothetical protein